VRAYSHSAKIALDAAGIAVMRLWRHATMSIPYNMFEIIQKLISDMGAKNITSDYGAEVSLSFVIPSEEFDALSKKVFDVSSGRVSVTQGEERYMAI